MGGIKIKVWLTIVFSFLVVNFSVDRAVLAQGVTQEMYDEFSDEDFALDSGSVSISDPYQSYNRMIFTFNDKAYYYFARPVSNVYDKAVPRILQEKIDNFFDNSRFPIRFVNCILQGKAKGAVTELGRFVINTATGFGGFNDPGERHFHLAVYEEDFGQTLAKYGLGSGFYLQWPIFGPSSVRDTIGFIGDLALNPLTYLGIYGEPEATYRGISGLQYVNRVAYTLGDNYESIKKSAIDPYIAIQDAYVQSRAKKINE